MARRNSCGVATHRIPTGRDLVLVRCDSTVVSSDKYSTFTATLYVLPSRVGMFSLAAPRDQQGQRRDGRRNQY